MKCKQHLFVFFLILASYVTVEGARILSAIPIFSKSHYTLSQPLLKALAKAGHEVVVYSPYPMDKAFPNYTDVFFDNVSVESEKVEDLLHEASQMPYYECLDSFIAVSRKTFTDFITSDKLQKLLTSNEHFDLVIVEAFVAQEFTLILGHIFKAPVIVFQSFFTNSVANSVSGNTLSISHIPDLCSPYSNKMSFFERLRNTFHVLRNLYYVYYNKHIPLQEKRLRKHFPDAPPLLDMINNVSLIFVNDHLTADYARPRTPNIIPVAGIHIEDQGLLPQDIQHFMDDAKDGVILFSLGTNVHDEKHSREFFEMCKNVFRQLRQRVLWKTRSENIQGLPDNVMTVNWIPQRDALAHHNCVLFITHGGLLSQHEAIHCGVPVVAIPMFWDQYRNGKFYEERGIGVQLPNWELNERSILSAIRKVLRNPQYKSNMKRLSQIFRDRPMTPAQTVVYWTEYVLRHGASHLRPASTQLSWYQLALLDVLAVILTVAVSLIYVTYIIFRRIISFIGFMKTNSLSDKQKFN